MCGLNACELSTRFIRAIIQETENSALQIICSTFQGLLLLIKGGAGRRDDLKSDFKHYTNNK